MSYKAFSSVKTSTPAVVWQMPEWANMLRGNSLQGTEGAYSAVPLVRRALRLSADTLSGLPYHVEDMAGNEVDWPFPTPLRNLLWNTDAGMHLYGHTEWLMRGTERQYSGRIVRNVMDVTWLHSRFIIPWYDPSQDMMRFSYSHPGPLAGAYTQDQVVYFHEFNPIHLYLPGPGAAQTALANAGLTHYLTRFASLFFEHGAMPVVMLTPDGGAAPTEPETRRIENWFKNAIAGIGNAWRVIATRTGFKSLVLTPPFKDMVIPELFSQSQEEVAKAFGIPQTLLDEASNKASAGDDHLRYYTDTVVPRALMFADTINSQLLQPAGLKLVFDFGKIEVFQSLELQRAQSLGNLTQNGVPLDIAMDLIGFKLTDEQRVRIAEKTNEPKPQPAFLPGQQPPALAQPPAAPMLPSGEETDEDTDEETDEPVDVDAAKAALKSWQYKAICNVRAGGAADIDFVTRSVPAYFQEYIHTRLAGASEEGEVKEVFKAVRRDLVELLDDDHDPDLAAQLKRANEILTVFQEARA